MPYCRRCGVELPKDSRFCPACGTHVFSPRGTGRLIAEIKTGSITIRR